MDNQYNYTEMENQEIYSPNILLEEKIQAKLEAKKTKKANRRRRAKKIINLCFTALLFGAISGGVFLGVTYYGEDVLGLENTVSTTSVETTTISNESSGEIVSDVATIASNVMPSIVSITNLSVQEVESFFGQSSTYESESVGSGIIIAQSDTELLILTNNHVIEDNDTLTVTFCNEDSVEAVIKGADSDKDLAVVAIKLENISDETLSEIKVATLGDSDSLQVGETVIAIGNALGYGQSVTTGVVSALDRTIDGFESTLIQTDAAINPGNSGGALLNANGEVIGINTAKVDADAVEGMGYAIPISEAMDTINELMNMETKEVVDEEERGYVGIQGVSVTEETAAMYSMPVGVYIAEVIEGGAAAEAGISKGSIITKLDGMTVDSIEDLIEKLTYYAAGSEAVITIETMSEGGEYVETEVTIVLQEYSE
ncbi:MAG: trypsin-like peptidase domain-containing protein [Eubacteriales bacterium]